MIQEYLSHLDSVFGEPAAVCLIAVFIAAASYTDIREKKIPDKLNLAMFLARGLIVFIYPLSGDCILGMLFGLLIILIPAVIMLVPMGGDIKFSAVLGIWLGIYGILVALLAGVVLFILTGAVRRLGRKDMMALGPFVSAGTVLLFVLWAVLR